MPRAKTAKKAAVANGSAAGKEVQNGDAVVSSTTSIASEEEEMPIKVASPIAKGRGRAKKRVTPVVEEISEVEEKPAPPVQKASAGRGRRKLGEVKESVAVVEEKKPAARAGRGAKKAAATPTEIAIDEVEVETKPKAKGRGRKVAAATAVVEQEPPIQETNGEEQKEEAPAKMAKTVKATGKGRKKKEVTPAPEVVPDEEVAPVEKTVPKKRSSKKAAIVEVPEAALEDDVAAIEEDVKTEAVKPKKTSGRAKKVAEVTEEKPAAAKRGRAKKIPVEIVIEDASDAVEDADNSPKKKPKKNVAAKAKPSEEKKKSATKSKAAAEDNIEEISSDIGLKEEAKPSKAAPPAAEKKQRGALKRAAAIVEDNDDDDDEADGGGPKPSKAKKAAPLNATDTIYNKADFELPPLESCDDDERFNLKIASWNVAGLRSWVKKDGLKFLEYEEPDIFCMQETKCTTDQLPDEAARLPGYHPYWLCMAGGYAGVAIYSKIMPINVEYGIGDVEFDDVGRVITAEYEKFFLVNVYVPNSGRKLVNLEPRMRWEKLFQQFVQKLDKHKPVIICGDMNVSHREIDLANPKTNTRNAGFTQEERDKMSELLALGYVDTFRHLYPQRKGAYTFWTYMSNARSRNVGWRLDYFITSERLIQRVVDNCLRTQCKGSDHCPITLFLKL